jgi:hypothetical protein
MDDLYFSKSKEAFLEGNFSLVIVLLKHVPLNSPERIKLLADAAYFSWEISPKDNIALVKESYTSLLRDASPELVLFEDIIVITLFIFLTLQCSRR